MVGGAAGDALGYAIEFHREEEIFSTYGPSGIQEYCLDGMSGKALISDDTQMTLFTAAGILKQYERETERGVSGPPSFYIGLAYEDWMKTQDVEVEGWSQHFDLVNVPELNCRRAPGITCLNALESSRGGNRHEPINSSKGCGGIMRVAPMGLFYSGKRWPGMEAKTLLEETSLVVERTHGHPLGYLPAAAVVWIIHEIMEGRVNSKEDLAKISYETMDILREVFDDEDPEYLEEMECINDLAVCFADNDKSDLENIHMLGEGWVAEETYGIALYCCLRHYADFSEVIRSAVNHKGDSDSTGAVAGNIMGAIVGYDAIDSIWKDDLELKDLIVRASEWLDEPPTWPY